MTLVGVIDADLGLTSGDPRAAERTFQALRQVTGRAGRGEKPGRALLQTHDPDHPVLKALISGDPERFYAAEEAAREAAGLPPFGRLAALIVSGTDRHAVEAHARALVRAAFDLPAASGFSLASATGAGPDDIDVLGPAEAPVAMVRGRYRYRILIKAPRSADLQAFVRAVLNDAPKERGNLRVTVDIEPQNFM